MYLKPDAVPYYMTVNPE